ncbi:MAG: Hsp20/alpha crystallin family protein [Opitutaceae bacterium]|nr:Hsp20/alpha crystallin family protein [Opitutaceae bacterium]
MHTIIRSIKTKQPAPAFASATAFRRPHYDCQEQTDALKLVVYVPGVEPAGIELEVRGPDLVVTAPKSHRVRANWRAAHLESAQRDYQLRLRLGFSLAYDALQAALHDGVLTITIPKKSVVVATCAVA